MHFKYKAIGISGQTAEHVYTLQQLETLRQETIWRFAEELAENIKVSVEISFDEGKTWDTPSNYRIAKQIADKVTPLCECMLTIDEEYDYVMSMKG